MRLATYLYILYIYVVVLAASWHKSCLGAGNRKLSKMEFLTPPWHWGPWLPISSSFNPDETCHILVHTIHLCRSTSGFLAQELVWEQETENYRKWNFLTPPWYWGPWLPISSSFNPNETCHIFLYNIYIYHSTSSFLAQELVSEQ